jgi:peptidoglycan hydrolase FlgJ
VINSGSVQARTGAEAYTDLSSVNALRSLGREDKNQALEKIAEQFESMMVRMMMKSMRSASAVFAEGNFLSSNEGDMYQEMLDDQLSLNLSKDRGMGIADAMVRQLKRNFGNDEPGGGKGVTSIGDSALGEYLKNRNQLKPSMAGLRAPEQAEAAGKTDISVIKFDGSVSQFVERLYPMAEKAARVLGVDADVLIAQAALETGWGAKITPGVNGHSSNNLFNIKADQRWQGASVNVATMEIRDGVAVRERAAFRAYPSAEHSFEDYADFVSNSYRYQQAANSGNSESYIRKLADAGYATDPAYADKVLRILNSTELKNAVKNASELDGTSNNAQLTVVEGQGRR